MGDEGAVVQASGGLKIMAHLGAERQSDWHWRERERGRNSGVSPFHLTPVFLQFLFLFAA